MNKDKRNTDASDSIDSGNAQQSGSNAGYSFNFPVFDSALSSDPTTRTIVDSFGSAHDFEAHEGISSSALRQKLFSSHFGHLAVIFLWTAGNLFHVSWQGNFQQWAVNPLKVAPIAHAIWDPHFGGQAIDAYTAEGFTYPANIALSGVYEWWYSLGIRTDMDLYFGALGLLASAALVLFAGWFHLTPSYRPSLQCLTESASELGHHIGTLVGLSSLAWAGHLIHVAVPESRGEHIRWYNFLSRPPHPAGLTPLFTRHWESYSQNPDGPGHIWGTSEGAGTAILTFLGGFNPQTGAMWLTDIAHHHLAIAVFFIFIGHLFETIWRVSPLKVNDNNLHIQQAYSYERELKTKGFAPNPFYENASRSLQAPGRLSLQKMVTDSLQLRLALTLLACGVGTSLVAQHMYALPSYAFLSSCPLVQIGLYVHHQFIAGCLMLGAFAHGAIFLVRDYNPISPESDNDWISWLLQNKEAIISTLSWASLFLGFHTLGIYVHNDACVAFGEPEKQILIEPVFAQFVQAASGKTGYGFSFPLTVSPTGESLSDANFWLPGWSEAVNSPTNSLFLTIGPGDLLVHHAIALGLHTTTLILVKGALDARGSKLMPDKKDFGYAFPCDGPGRGGTCDISAWDAFYLAAFWMLNTISWTIFYVHWASFSSTSFATNSTYLMGWFSAYLWNYSAEVIGGYSAAGTSSGNAVWTWTFHFAHLTWATGFMFLISWRGYWQELIETLVWAHQRTPIANQIDWVHKPVALSIVQARLVGLWHFAVGLTTTFAAFLLTTSA
jgi:photosystem I P700 chlorophyll a apoprotein A2